MLRRLLSLSVQVLAAVYSPVVDGAPWRRPLIQKRKHSNHQQYISHCQRVELGSYCAAVGLSNLGRRELALALRFSASLQ
jgi:hypothetical protein